MPLNRFRWVYYQLESLQPCFPNNLPRMLKELPKPLDETYKRVLEEINNANRKQAHELLQCLAVACRPLRVEELAEVFALDIDAGGIPTFNANWRWEDHETAVLSACSSLVSVFEYYGARVVQFSHFSVKEFLTSDRLTSMEDVSQFYIAHEPSHMILAQACIGVMLSLDDRTSQDSVEDLALLPYAVEYWSKHIQVGKVELRMMDALDCLFDVDKPHFEALLRRGNYDELRQFRVPSDEDPNGVLTPVVPFLVACMNGLRGLAERLIVSNRQQIIRFRVRGWPLLHWVVRRKSIDATRLLLAHGADINSRTDYATPPHTAPLQSHVERLVDGADESLQISGSEDSNFNLEYEKENGFTPLHIAVEAGNLDMCQMLVEHEADVHAQDNKGNTPLHLALSGDRLEIARILLKYDAEVNSQNDEGSTPLHLASEGYKEGNPDTIRLLLEYGADTQARNLSGKTASEVACGRKRQEIIQLFSKHAAK